jgi:hypothetical protein
MNVYRYWHDKEKTPEFIQYCFSFGQNVVYDWERFADELLEPRERDLVAKHEPAHQADIFRTRVLYKYGGVYLDADAIIQDPLFITSTIAQLAEYRYVGVTEFDSLFTWKIANGFMASAAESPMMKRVILEQNRLIRKPIRRRWTQLGSDILTKVIKGKGLLIHPFTMFSSTPSYRAFQYWFTPLSIEEKERRFRELPKSVIMFFGKGMFPLYQNTIEQLKEQDGTTLLSYFLKNNDSKRNDKRNDN